MALRRPQLGGALFWVWLRNARVWRRSWKTSLVGAVGEPLLYFLGLGLGLSAVIPSIGGQSYLHFVAPGLMLSAVMQSTTIEATYSTFTKMEHQKIYASMLLSPLAFDEIVVGELLWAVTKGMISGGTVFALSLAWGVGQPWPGILALGLLLLAGVIFACLGFIVTSLASGYESFNYYFTLFISPMFFFSGIFFPLQSLGGWLEKVAWFFPLAHLVRVSRALFAGGSGAEVLPDLLWLGVFALGVLWLALLRMERRFLP